MSDYDDHDDHDCQVEVESAMESYAEHQREQREQRPHEPDERCPTNTHCFSCNVDEPDRPGDFRVCGECCHIFRTAEDLVAAEQRLLAEMRAAGFEMGGMTARTDADLIDVCPLCTHSF